MKSLVLDEVEKLSALDSTSIWAALGSEIHAIRFDDKLITKLFASDSSKSKPKKKGGKMKKGIPLSNSLSLIDPKRQHNLSISMSRLKVPVDTLCKSLMSIDTETLTANIVDVLKLVMPLPQEMKVVRQHASKNPPDQPTKGLGKVELFFYHLSSIPRLEEKMRAIDLKSSLKYRVDSIKEDIAVLSTAMVFITKCGGLRRLMGLVLQLSNYLNHGSYRSGAFGFKVGSLKKLMSLRSNVPAEGKTLLHVIAKMANTDPLLAEVEDMLQLGPATFIPSGVISEHTQSLRHDINALKDENTLCAEEIASNDIDEEDTNMSNTFVEASTNLLESSEAQFGEIEELQRQLRDHQAVLAHFLCEDPETFKHDVTIKELHDFAKSFTKIRAEEKRLTAAKERRKALQIDREEKSRQREQDSKTMSSGSKKSNGKNAGAAAVATAGGGGGNVNRLLDGMLRGSFLDRTRKAPPSRRDETTPTQRIRALSIAMQGDIDEEVSSDGSDWDSD